MMIQWLDSSVSRWKELRSLLSCLKLNDNGRAIITKEIIEGITQLSFGIRGFYEGLKVNEKLINYEKKLRDLTSKWHLKAKWAGLAFIINHFFDIVGITQEDIWKVDGSIEFIEPLLDEIRKRVKNAKG